MTNFFKKNESLKAIIIDWDGTLVDVEPVIHQAYKETLKDINSPLQEAWSPIDTHAQNGLAPVDIFNNQLIWGESSGENGVAKKLFYQHYRRLLAADENAPYLKEGALELLQTLKAAYPQTRLVILAAKSDELLKKEVASKTELAPWINTVIGTDPERGFSKQNDIIFYESVYGLTISKESTLRQKEVIYIGDNVDKDTHFAKICSITPLIVNDKNKAADYTSLKELSNAVREAFRERTMTLLRSQNNTPSVVFERTNSNS